MWPDSLHLVIPGNTRPQQWDRTRAAFVISLLLTLCILGLIGVLYGSLPSPCTPPHPAPTSLVLLADGQAAEYQGASLGIYDRLNTRLNNASVYRQRGGSIWLYRVAPTEPRSVPYWFVGTNLGTNTGTMRTRSLEATGTAWEYGVGGSDWVGNDTSIALVSIEDPWAHCLTCRTILLNSSGPSITLLPTFFGNFSIMEGVYMDGRPVYRNAAGRFIHKDSLATFGVRADFTGDGASIQTASGPICLFNEKASKSERWEEGWKFWTGSAWEVDDTITASCVHY